MSRLFFTGFFLIALCVGGFFPSTLFAKYGNNGSHLSQTDELLSAAFKNQQSNVQVQGRGRVKKILPDDTEGSRHQRFIVQLASGQTVLIAHNIDLANRVAGLHVGDTIRFYGEYEWNAQGGVLHWTHRDPQRRHINGWLKHKGVTYE